MASEPTFEIGITMAGAVSAGAYTAGVMDFLIEAIDAWETAKAELKAGTGSEPLCPTHSVSLRVMSGASAGSIVSAIVAANIDQRWTPVRKANADNQNTQNPLFESWVNQVDIRPMLGKNDLKADAMPVSLLDATTLDQIAEAAFNFRGTPIKRSYIANPLRTIFTLTNLTGVPFRYDLRGNTDKGQDLTMHGDLMRFATLNAGMASAPAPRLNADASYEYLLPPVAVPKWEDFAWHRYASVAIASGAFPLGLRPREIERNKSDFTKIPLLASGDISPLTMTPAWTAQPNEKYKYLSVDGGCIDNEPLQHARIELSGSPNETNPRKGNEAHRAVIMIDPFVGPSEAGPSKVSDNPLHLAFFKLFGAIINNSRFKADDIELAYRPDVFSRFMIAPRRPTPPLMSVTYANADGQWIACGALGGFSGFLEREYRKHDFLLGRRNCQQFLAYHFSLHVENHLFDIWRQNSTMLDYFVIRGTNGKPDELPVIPLVGSLHPRHGIEEPLPDWPSDKFNFSDIEPLIRSRLDGLFDKYNGRNSLIFGTLLRVAWLFSKARIVSKVKDFLLTSLEKQGLLTPERNSTAGGVTEIFRET